MYYDTLLCLEIEQSYMSSAYYIVRLTNAHLMTPSRDQALLPLLYR